MELTPEKIEELKRQHPEGVYKGSIGFMDETGRRREVEFAYRKPVTADVEAHGKSAQRNPLVASLNLLQSLVVYPAPAPIVEALREYPAATGKFVEECVMSFFGADVTVKTGRL